MQSGLVVSMIASLAVERYRMSVYRAPEISMMRASVASPFGLFWPLVSQPTDRWNSIPVLLALVVLLVTAAWNFASTILLSDLGPGWYSEALRSVPVSVDLDSGSSIDSGGTSYVSSKPDVFPFLAEYTEPALEDLLVKDTGATVRALPPFLESRRSSLNYYSGVSLLVNSRVMCVNPRKSLDIKVRMDRTWGSVLFVSGLLHTQDIAWLPNGSNTRGGVPFNCSATTYHRDSPSTKRVLLD